MTRIRAHVSAGTRPQEELPAWTLAAEDRTAPPMAADWPHPVTREWAWGGSRGDGVRVCIVDSGVDGGHPLVGGLQKAVVPGRDADEAAVILPDADGDASGHGTAAAGIIRSLAPACEISSVRVLGSGLVGAGADLLAGLRWAIEQGHQVVNLSLSTTRRAFLEELHDLADQAYFQGTILVACAHNLRVESWPWRFASVVSVAGHEGDDPLEFHHNPAPPVELFARAVDVEVAWLGGQTIRATGNSFAAPHIAGLCALILAKHPGLTPSQLKTVLHLTASNAGAA